MGHNELLLGELLRQRRREEVVLSVKFNGLRDPAGHFIGFDSRPAAVKNFLAYSLQRLVEALRPVAAALGLTIPQVALAWVTTRGEDIVPLIGTRQQGSLDEALRAMDVRLTPEDCAAIEVAIPKDAAHGDRYPPAAGVPTRRRY